MLVNILAVLIVVWTVWMVCFGIWDERRAKRRP